MLLLRKAKSSTQKKANVICLIFVWTVSGALRNNACKQNKVSAITSLMCKSYKLCYLPAFLCGAFQFKHLYLLSYCG